MHPLTLLLPLLPISLSGPTPNPTLTPRDANSIVTAITAIESRIATLNNTLNTFFPRAPTALLTVLAVETETTQLGNSISAATSTVNQTPALSDADSQTVALATLGLEPNIFSLLTNIESRKPAFDTAILGVGSVSPTVEQSLKQQADLSAALGQAIAAKLTAEFAGPAATVNADIASAFAKAVQIYSVPGGIFSLPPFPSLGSS
ncbi:hypothetical protein MMC10_011159 [Thelotrema lepadinum]|nr:hypothetical protein [Thelotrema lepadinum]